AEQNDPKMPRSSLSSMRGPSRSELRSSSKRYQHRPAPSKK
ncbi:12915_t:CDS:1, partial [Funneliformis mosseae]